MLNNSIVAKLLFQHYKPTLLDENTCLEYTCINGVFCYNQTLSNTSYCIHFMLVLFKVLILFQESPTYEFKPFTKTTNARLSLYLFISVYFQWHLQVCLVCSCRHNSSWLCLTRIARLFNVGRRLPTIIPNLGDLWTIECNEGRQRWFQPSSVLSL